MKLPPSLVRACMAGDLFTQCTTFPGGEAAERSKRGDDLDEALPDGVVMRPIKTAKKATGLFEEVITPPSEAPQDLCCARCRGIYINSAPKKDTQPIERTTATPLCQYQ